MHNTGTKLFTKQGIPSGNTEHPRVDKISDILASFSHPIVCRILALYCHLELYIIDIIHCIVFWSQPSHNGHARLDLNVVGQPNIPHGP